jgi:F-box and leucine-rich repeat protein GRR1
VFCVFSGRGVTDLRTHLNKQIPYPLEEADDDFDNDTVNDADDDQTMTGMMGATALNADDEDADGDEELDADVEGA